MKWIRDARRPLLIASICLAAYLPAFNNGFISDDYVILGRLDSLRHDALYLFSSPPECFRLTSYVCFGVLKFLFGYHSAGYYAFNLALHFVNSILVLKFVARISGSAQVGFLAGMLFASAQGHQEAVMWLAAMNETLLGFYLLSCMLCWRKDQTARAVFWYLPSLFSKESALVLLGLLPWFDRRLADSRRDRRRYVVLLTVSMAFAVLFYALLAGNFMITAGSYSVGLNAVPVFLLSMHRMLFPWLYLAMLPHLLRRRPGPLKTALRGLGFSAVALVPYVFLTYQNHITSRQEYLASIGLAWSLAVLIQGFETRNWRTAFLLSFIAGNIGYLWMVKDRQFEIRAAPTNRLIERLSAITPQNVAIRDFPANPWIARNAAGLLPGWLPSMIHVNPTPSECRECLELRWNPAQNTYAVFGRGP